MKQKIAFIVSAPITARVFLTHQIGVLSRQYDVTVIANLNHGEDELGNLPVDVHIYSLPIERNISCISDFKALVLLVRLFLREKFMLIHSVSPKAGFLSSIAGYISRIPNRLHTFTGQVWVTQSGFKRWLLKSFDKLIACMATMILADSNSQRDFLVKNRLVDEGAIKVLGKGSISGVDLDRFHPSLSVRESTRRELNINESATVLLFVGRLKIDKGVLDLAKAFKNIYRSHSDAILLYIGPDEEELKAEVINISGAAQAAIRFISYTDKPEDYMAAADIFVLPSYREGFGSVVIEAAACELPTAASRIYGLTDAIEEGETGLMFEAGDIDGIVQTVSKLIVDKELRERLGKNARKRVNDNFTQERVTNALSVLYNDLLSKNNPNLKK